MNEQPERMSATEFAETHYKTPALIEHRIRCGSANCKCISKYRHGPYAYLYWRDGIGKAHRVYVRKEEVERVREIVSLRKQIEQERRMLLAEAQCYLRYLRNLGKD